MILVHINFAVCHVKTSEAVGDTRLSTHGLVGSQQDVFH